MKHLTAQLRLISLLSLILCAWTAAYAQITPSADSYTVTGDPTTNYGAKTLLDVESPTQTTYIQFNLSSIPTSYTSTDITKATLKLYVNTVTTAGSFNVDYVNGTWTESTITVEFRSRAGNDDRRERSAHHCAEEPVHPHRHHRGGTSVAEWNCQRRHCSGRQQSIQCDFRQ